MNLHKNARTCPKSRALMVKRVEEEGRPVSEVSSRICPAPLSGILVQYAG